MEMYYSLDVMDILSGIMSQDVFCDIAKWFSDCIIPLIYCYCSIKKCNPQEYIVERVL